MDAVRTKLLGGDGLTVPASLRQALGLRPGDDVLLELHGDEPHVRAETTALRRVQDLLAPFGPTVCEPPISEQLIAERRGEAARE